MTQPTPQPQSPPQAQIQPFAPMPVFKALSQYIEAAASGSRDSLFHLVVAIFTAARAALACLTRHYQSHPRLLTLDKLARIKYCAARLHAILHTLQHAPERFLAPAQLRALTRAQTILAHLWRQPVDFTPLVPFLTSPEACPPPPRSPHSAFPSSDTPASSESEPSSAPATPLSESPHLRVSASSSPTSDPLLLRSPGCALTSVLLHIAALYGLSSSPRSPLRAPHASSPAPSATPYSADQSVMPHSPSTPASPNSSIPHSKNPQFPLRPPP